MRLNEKKVIASFEAVVMIASLFAFSYFIYASEDIFEKLKEPMIPVVSAEQFNTALFGVGCCALAIDGQKCATATADTCFESALFAEGALCSATSFCRKGCCYDEDAGIYDKNVLKSDCPKSWVNDPNCNMPAAKLGCCVLGINSIFETEGQCRVDSLSRALGADAVVNWNGDVNEAQCLMLSTTQIEGACVLAGGDCKSGTETDCLNYGGQFNDGYLCTSPSLNTTCEATEETTCVEGKDGVYFVDSCGNYANIYDSSKLNDINYWDRVISPEDSCGAGNINNGNANSKNCGNCNRFLGGICASVSEENFDVDFGRFYCKATSCMFEGKSYRNGESWCVYDGKIGDGDDVVGSRHWKYVCSQGVVQVEPCADYRNQICIQTNTFDIEGTEVQFKNAACIANNWRECINLNGEEDGLELCEKTLNCRIENVNITDNFNFSVCTPKYPGGFSFKEERYQKTAKAVCGMADQNCTVVYQPKTWGGCKLVANEGCLEEKFAQEMNDLCRRLGDCGGEVNIEGVYSENYKVGNSPKLSQSWIDRLRTLAKPVEGQFAEVEDYSRYLEAAGLSGSPDSVPEGGEGSDMGGMMNNIGMGIAGIGYAAGVVSLWGVKGALMLKGLTTAGSSLAAFSGVAIGAGIGMIAGAILAKSLGLSPGGSLMMSIGGGLIGAAVSIWLMKLQFLYVLIGPLSWIGIILIILYWLFGGDDCDPVTVTFECKPWQPPVGGEDCEKCNKDLLKPCSEYRCNSLGASCELINIGSDHELCVDGGRDDTRPPRIEPQLGTISPDKKYSDVSEGGFSLTSLQENCIDAYSPLIFGVTTDEPAQCRFDIVEREFDEMSFDFGGNYYSYNHTTTFTLPDPSHGQSQGGNWTGDLTLYIKCRDTKGHESPGFYTVDICVKEGPDKTAPMIRAVKPADGMVVNFETTSENLKIITNELSTCKWDSVDIDYSSMANSMICNDVLAFPSSPIGYVCSAELPIMNSTNSYYIRCMDQPWLDSVEGRNANTQSYVYTLRRPEKKIEIDWIKPGEDFESATEMTTIELQIQTSGGGEWHYCSYSFSGYDNMIEMFETGTDKIHVQQLNRPLGTNKIYIECQDETEDSVQSWTEFEIIKNEIEIEIEPIEDFVSGSEEVIVDLLVRTSGGGNEHNCSYSLSAGGVSVEFKEQGNVGIHEQEVAVAVGSQTIYVKCWDEAGNLAEGDISFRVTYDTSTPQVARVWQTGSTIYIVTTEDAECIYDTTGCKYAWGNGVLIGNGKTHTISATGGKIYYVKCKDEFGNAPSGCSILVQGT